MIRLVSAASGKSHVLACTGLGRLPNSFGWNTTRSGSGSGHGGSSGREQAVVSR